MGIRTCKHKFIMITLLGLFVSTAPDRCRPGTVGLLRAGGTSTSLRRLYRYSYVSSNFSHAPKQSYPLILHICQTQNDPYYVYYKIAVELLLSGVKLL